ncbi:MAG: hypothetical protein CL840_01300 [Crocinitomicaceae bacterium]|jgi:hypothetical protein|nr:hypothetical protein [Crocinitomicaceae bacterium]|tara:strand:+ start:30556 stop:31101 length:546 start_codon:yes stop_codon:yes gene_type:complete
MKATRLALATALLCTSAISSAASDYPGQANTSHHMAVNYHYLADSELDDIDLSAATVSHAYQMRNTGGNFSFGPVIAIGSGAGKFEESGVKLNIDGMAQFGLRLTYYPCEYFHVFLKPTVTQIWLDGTQNGVDILGDDDTSTESGITMGLGFDVNDNYSIDLSAEKIGDYDVVTGSVSYRF